MNMVGEISNSIRMGRTARFSAALLLSENFPAGRVAGGIFLRQGGGFR